MHLIYTCQLSCLIHESQACKLKASISCIRTIPHAWLTNPDKLLKNWKVSSLSRNGPLEKLRVRFCRRHLPNEMKQKVVLSHFIIIILQVCSVQVSANLLPSEIMKITTQEFLPGWHHSLGKTLWDLLSSMSLYLEQTQGSISYTE